MTCTPLTHTARRWQLRYRLMPTRVMRRTWFAVASAAICLAGCAGSSTNESLATTTVEEGVVTTTETPSTTTTTTTTLPVVAGDCTVSSILEIGATSDEVMCLERHLNDRGWLSESPNDEFDEATRVAVRTFQANHDPKLEIVIDGIAGQQTLEMLGLWLEPPPPEPDVATCEGLGDAAVLDREFQRAWLCADDAIIHVFPVTTAWDQPDPGDYEVEQRSLEASSILTGSYSEMSHFVVFTYGKFQGARVGFHSVPIYPGGEYVQPLESVGTPELRGDSNGCIRALPEDAEKVWDHLGFGAIVRVIS